MYPCVHQQHSKPSYTSVAQTSSLLASSFHALASSPCFFSFHPLLISSPQLSYFFCSRLLSSSFVLFSPHLSPVSSFLSVSLSRCLSLSLSPFLSLSYFFTSLLFSLLCSFLSGLLLPFSSSFPPYLFVLLTSCPVLRTPSFFFCICSAAWHHPSIAVLFFWSFSFIHQRLRHLSLAFTSLL